MIFEYDHLKNIANQEKHGISFNEAKAIWNDVYVEIPAKTVEGEERHAVIGKIEEKCWVAIVQHKIIPKGKIVRIISVRRAREKEEKYYEAERSRDEYYQSL
jgi:uncharacterized protein